MFFQGVTHLVTLSATDFGSYMRCARLPHGPTLSFKISQYSLMQDVKKGQARPRPMGSTDKQRAPLLILTGGNHTRNEWRRCENIHLE